MRGEVCVLERSKPEPKKKNVFSNPKKWIKKFDLQRFELDLFMDITRTNASLFDIFEMFKLYNRSKGIFSAHFQFGIVEKLRNPKECRPS